MRVSLSWVASLLGVDRLPVSTADLHQRLTLRTAEIETDIERSGPRLDGVVVGRVLTCVQHPNADRLRVTTVDIGAGRVVPIVCGAPNVAAGQTVAVATVGCTLYPGGDAKPLTIKSAKLRGEASEGMICAEDELGLGVSHDGILVLDAALVPGTPLAQVLGGSDEIFLVDNHGISHRPDLWGQLGWAREIAGLCGLPAPAVPDIDFFAQASWSSPVPAWTAELVDDGCLSYGGVVIEGVHHGASPAWMQRRLEAGGVRPLGLLVDVTNYVMLELGQPLHAFDRAKLRGTTITVRAARDGEVLATLDGRNHALAAGELVIDDAGTAIALAGVMGGESTKVSAATTAIVLEAALFKPERIRRARIHLGSATDSSARFEKGLPPELIPAALARAIAVLRDECPNLRITQAFRAGLTAGEARTITYDGSLFRRYFGEDLAVAEQDNLLASLGIVREAGVLRVPWWRRKDLNHDVDVVEEVGRLRGFEHIAGEVPRLPAAVPAANPLRLSEHAVRRALSAQGWDEVATYPFANDTWAARLGWDAAQTIRLANPLSAEWTVLRGSLLPGLAEALARNRRTLDQQRCYEIGKRYGKDIGSATTPDETLVCVGLCSAVGDETPVYAARDAALAAVRGLGHAPTFVAEVHACQIEDAALQTGRTGTCLIGKLPVAWCGELARPLRQALGLDERVGIFAIALERLVSEAPAPTPVRFVTPSRFQAVDRDFTWVCPEALPFAALREATTGAAKGLCQAVHLVGIYRGAPYAAGEKAVSLRVVFQADDRTLEDAEMTKLQEAIRNGVERRTAAKLRVG